MSRKFQVMHPRIPIAMYLAIKDAAQEESRSIQAQLLYWTKKGMPDGLLQRYEQGMRNGEPVEAGVEL